MPTRDAFGAPGDEPRWTYANKDGVGTAYSVSSRIWFTLVDGAVTEIYYPTVDRPQVRDVQYIVTDGATFAHEERRHLDTHTEPVDPWALGYRLINRDRAGRYVLEKEVICDPHYPCVLQQTILRGEADAVRALRVFATCNPHLDVGGSHNSASVVELAGRQILVAVNQGTWLAMAATRPFARVSCGYVGRSDGWTDLADDYRMDWAFDRAADGNVSLTGEIDRPTEPFTLGVALGNSLHNAVTTLLQALDIPFADQRARFVDQWQRATRHLEPLASASGDGGRLYASSYSLLMAHEDKTYPGAIIASLSIPWGESKSDDDRGGYHLVWTRDLVNSVGGLLAAGNLETPRRALTYLAASQREDGGFAQNAWIDGTPYWTGIQLDEVAFPILLARRLFREHALREFDPYPTVLAAAAYLVQQGPATEQDRWEEAGGFSPATLANNIAALVCAAAFVRERGDDATAAFLEDYADFLEQHVECWTVTTDGTLVAGIRRHYIRILPVDVHDPRPTEDPNLAALTLANVKPGNPYSYPAKEIVDAGFLDLVRYGVRRADDPLVVDSLRVVDAVLKVETPCGPGWRRYNHDGYGQRDDGGPYQGWGVGRAWPLLTGERAHYELAAGGDVRRLLVALERFASATGLLPEQIWDEADRPDRHLWCGRPTGAAMPLMWAHAEYIKLLRSVRDGMVFDRVPEVAARYCHGRRAARALNMWKRNHQIATVERGTTLRVIAAEPFQLHWSADEWQTVVDTAATPTALRVSFVDIPVAASQRAPIRFTFLWSERHQWEGRDYAVAVSGRPNAG